MKVYTESKIIKSYCSFGEYEFQQQKVNPENSQKSVDELLELIEENTDGVEEISKAITLNKFIKLGVKDIRGRIHYEPPEVYVYIQQDQIFYFGIVESEVEDDFFD